jgi:hypothetical protein
MKKVEAIILTRKDLREDNKGLPSTWISSPMNFKMSYRTYEKAALIIYQYGLHGECKVLKNRFGKIS